jgi:hypothetical protein
MVRRRCCCCAVQLFWTPHVPVLLQYRWPALDTSSAWGLLLPMLHSDARAAVFMCDRHFGHTLWGVLDTPGPPSEASMGRQPKSACRSRSSGRPSGGRRRRSGANCTRRGRRRCPRCCPTWRASAYVFMAPPHFSHCIVKGPDSQRRCCSIAFLPWPLACTV